MTVPIADTSGFTPAHPASNLVDDNGALTYSSDIPTNTQFCTGTGSVDCTGVSTALSTANSMGVGSGQGIITAAQVAAAGGLTMEVWVKNPTAVSSPAAALNMGGMYVLGVDSTGNVGFWHGDNSNDGAWTTPPPVAGEWMHLAVVMKTTDPAAQAFTDISAYLDGNLIHSAAITIVFFLTRATSVGNHQYANWSDYEGLVYEPRITLGALTPDKFTIKPPPVFTTITANPTNVLVQAGHTATFYVTATVSGAPPSSLTYQWQANDVDIPDATNASYTTPATTVADNLTTFRCGVSAPGVASPNYSQRATLYVYGQQGTLIRYAFAFTSGNVAANGGGFVTNNANPGVYNGLVLTGDGGTYGTDLPPANRLTNTLGVGSLDLSTGALSTDPTGPTTGAGILNFEDIAGNGGLTLETWVKGGTNSGFILDVADTYVLSATASGVQFGVDAAVASGNVDTNQWHHVAGVIRNATLSGGALHGNVSLYVDSILQGTVTNATMSNDRGRAATVGNHSLVNLLGINAPFTGLVYEPRITLGALAPSQFTTLPPPVVITITNQPQSAYSLPGGSATLTVGATVTGASPADLRYQWQQNGTDIVGATAASYTTPTLVAGATDNYRCLITVVGSTTTALSNVATVQAANHTGTIIQYGFDYINNSVAVNGTVTNDAIAGLFDGQVLVTDGGTYTNDVPPASLLQHTTGIGSLDLSTGSITTDPTGATSGQGVLNWADILANGGLTLETWVKGPYGANANQIIMTVAGEYALLAQPGSSGPIQFVNGFKETSDIAQAPVDLSQWHHIAGVLSNPVKPGSDLVGNLNLYVDGILQGTFTNSDFLTLDLQRGFSVGNHPLAISLGINDPFPGLVYEPRVTLGALSPAQFTIKVMVPPTIISFGPHSGSSFPLTFSGPAGQTYKVLTSTNVALPIGSWTTLTSGPFGASPVTYTDTAATSAHQFYRIVSP